MKSCALYMGTLFQPVIIPKGKKIGQHFNADVELLLIFKIVLKSNI